MSLLVIATGGTFDKRYDPIAGILGFGETHLHALLPLCRLNQPARVLVLSLKDSLDMIEADRQAVLAACQAAPESQIVVIHGTDTMPETARVLADASLEKTIVLTGAMVPYDLAGSDALFNLGFAAAVAQIQGAGVFVAMGGQVFDGSAVRKDRAVGKFLNA